MPRRYGWRGLRAADLKGAGEASSESTTFWILAQTTVISPLFGFRRGASSGLSRLLCLQYPAKDRKGGFYFWRGPRFSQHGFDKLSISLASISAPRLNAFLASRFLSLKDLLAVTVKDL
jgi:hypothetical protein